MSCSLTYDDALSRVRIDATSLCATGVVDTYTRTVTGGWGTATSGQSWTVSGTASDYSVASGVGRQNNITENSFRNSTINVGTTDFDYTISVQTDKLAVGSEQIVELAARWTDTQNYYAARVSFQTDATIDLDVRRRVANVQTVLSSVLTTSLTHVISTLYRIRVSVAGTMIKAKVWLASGTEPNDWMVEGTDATLTTGTNITVRSVLASAASNEPVLFSFDNLTSNPASYALIDRTTNGVTYTIVRGATDVGITTGCELERTIDDYEFPVGVEITYRIRSYTSGDGLLVTTTCTITVDLDEVWLKSIGRPFLNRVLHCVSNPSPIIRRARNGVFPVVNRSYPIAVTDTRGSREVTVPVITQTTQEREDLDLLLASGDPVFVQTPLNHPLPTMYAIIEDTTESRPVRNRDCNNDWRLFDLPMIEIVAPGPDVVGTTGTWQTVVNTYATWADVISNNATWADLLELIGDGTEVIVP